MSTHEVQTYQDSDGQWRWRAVVKEQTPHEGESGVRENIVADSGQGYSNKEDMCKSFFGMVFGDWNDSFLALYNEWDPQGNKLDPPGAVTDVNGDAVDVTTVESGE